jgi:phosphoglycerate dehydrogenase-like enzyme/SAM-dependent methyltransferase
LTQAFHICLSRDFLNDDGKLAYGDVGLWLLEEAAGVTYGFLDERTETLTPAQIAGSDGLIIIYPRVTPATFAQGAERLTVIARAGAGFEKVDPAACTANDVLVVNAPHAVRLPTAAGSLTFMLALSKRLFDQDRITRQARWDLRAEVMGTELAGRTLGIVGLGSAGRELARLAAPFNMRLLAHSPHADPAQARALKVELVPLDDLLRQADFVCLHCRLTEATRGLIGDRELGLMKPAAYLINMARGPVVDHDALVAALRRRQIAGAGLDVFHQEPLPAGDPVLALDNVILSPHWIAGTRDAFVDAGVSNCTAMLAAASGRVPDNVVNPQVLERPGFQAKLARWAAAPAPGRTAPAAPGAGYDPVAAKYAREYFDELQHKPFDRHLLDRFADRVRGLGPVCDLGCGPGQVARYLHERGVDAFGMDVSPAMLAEAARLSPGLHFEPGDMRALPAADGAWGGIAAFYAIIHIRPAGLPAVLRELARVLRPGGRLLLAFHIGDDVIHLDEWWHKPVSLDFYFYRLEAVLAGLREAGFEIEEATERAPYEPHEHPSRRGYVLARRQPS